MEKNKVSIIVPIYNICKYLERCINSLLNQTYKNLEIILIDDGSTDESYDICKKYEKKDSRILLIKKKNQGVSSARNTGLRKAKGEFCTFVDADDFIGRDFIKTLVSYQIKNNYDIVISNAIDCYENNSQKIYNPSFEAIELDKKNSIKEFLRGQLFTCVCWGNLYKTNMIKKNSFDCNMRIAEDGKFLLDSIELSEKNIIIPERLYYYFIRKDSVVHSGFSEKYYDEMKFCKELIYNFDNDMELKKEAENKYNNFLLNLLYFKDIKSNDLRNIAIELKNNKNLNKGIKCKVRNYILTNKVLRRIFFAIREEK